MNTTTTTAAAVSQSGGTPLLSVSGLSVRYGKVEALHDVSIEVRPGQIVSVIGPNGAGKSTLLGAIMGALPSIGHA